MKNICMIALLAATGTLAYADEVYVGVGFPGLSTVGYVKAFGDSANIRGELSGGASWNAQGSYETVHGDFKLKSTTAGVYGDWFPFETNGFRLVGGLVAGDTQATLTATGTGTANIGGAVNVDLRNEYYKVKLTMPSVAPYVGLGYGHRSSAKPGLGFYADLGFQVGTMKVTSETSVVGKFDGNGNTITAEDVAQQDKKIRDSVNKLKVLPVLSVGLTYRF